jgi:hypothetical protein
MDELLKGRISILEPVVLSGEARNTREMFAGTRAPNTRPCPRELLASPGRKANSVKEGLATIRSEPLRYRMTRGWFYSKVMTTFPRACPCSR